LIFEKTAYISNIFLLPLKTYTDPFSPIKPDSSIPVNSENPCTSPEAGGEIKTLTFEQ
jgi:hypothetical protein